MSRFRTKKELDNHVRDTLTKIPSEQERALRCFSFARAYVAMREFESARLYLESYLQSNPPSQNAAAAEKLMGDILVELGQEEEAFDHYKKSYGISKTRDVLNKICGLLQNGYGIKETPQSRTQWLNLQKATTSLEDYNPKSPYATSIKQSVSVTGTGLFSANFFAPHTNGSPPMRGTSAKSATAIPTNNANNIEDIGENLTKLIASNKATVVHHSTLLQFYLTDHKFKQGAAHVHKFMIKFSSNYEFLEKAIAVVEEAVSEHENPSSHRSSLDHFKGTVLTEAELFSAYFFVLENLIALLLDSRLKDVIPEAVGDNRTILAARWLHKFDQALFTKGRKVKFSPLESWWPSFLKHCRSQLSFYLGILSLIRSEKDSKHEQLFQPCFVAASSYIVDQPISLIKLRDPKLQQRAFIESTYRVFVCQTILSNFTKPVTFTADLKALIYDRCFPAKEDSSFSSSKLSSEFFNLPTEQKAAVTNANKGSPCQPSKLSDEKFWLQLKVSQLLYPESLHHQVWLQTQALERESDNSTTTNHEFATLLHAISFEDIPLSTYATDKADADSISQLDVDIFLTLSTFQAWSFKHRKPINYSKQIPNLTPDLVNSSQSKWWSSAAKFTHGTDGISEWAATECRLQVQRGLEMVRNLENTLPLSYIDALGKAFTSAAIKLEKTGVAKQFLHLSVSPNDLHQIYFDAAEHYCKMFVSQSISLTESSSSSLYPTLASSKSRKNFIRFMDIKEFPELTNPSLALEKARFVLGWRATERRDFETALSHFTETSFPESSMFAAEIYKILAEEELEVSNADSGEKNKALLQKAKELLYETVDRKSNKPVEYLLGKTSLEAAKAPLPHPKLEDEHELYLMIDEVEEKLKFLGMNTSLNLNRSVVNGSSSMFVAEGDETGKVSDRGDTSVRHPLEESIPFVIKTPAQKTRRSLIQELQQKQESPVSTTPIDKAKSPPFSSTPKKSDYENISISKGVEAEIESAEAYAFDELLEKLLEQNNVILDTISQMEDEIKDLNDRFTQLKKSKRCFQRKKVSFASSAVFG